MIYRELLYNGTNYALYDLDMGTNSQDFRIVIRYIDESIVDNWMEDFTSVDLDPSEGYVALEAISGECPIGVKALINKGWRRVAKCGRNLNQDERDKQHRLVERTRYKAVWAPFQRGA